MEKRKKVITALGLRKNLAVFNGIFFKNPILVTGLVIAPAAVAAYSLKTALALAIVELIVTVPTVTAASVIRRYIKNIPQFLLPVTYVLIASAMLIPAFFLIRWIFTPSIINALGIYGPLLAFNSIIFSRAKKYPLRNHPGKAALDAFSFSIGFGLSICIVGAVREILGAGTIWDIMVNPNIKFFGFLMPFGGCITVAFLAAFARQAIVCINHILRRMRIMYRWFKRKRSRKKKAVWKGNGAF